MSTKFYVQGVDTGTVDREKWIVTREDGLRLGTITQDTLKDDGIRIWLDQEHSPGSGTTYISMLEDTDLAIAELVKWAARTVDIELHAVPAALYDPDEESED